MAAGYEEQQRLQAAGFTPREIVEWEQKTTQELTNAGFSPSEINDYFGRGAPDASSIKDVALRDFRSPSEEEKPAMEARGFIDALAAGYQTSVSGLTQRQAPPDILLPEDADFVEVFGSAVGQLVGDLPVSVPSFFAGAKIGAPVGAAAGGMATRNPIGTAAGTVAGAGIGGGAVSGFVTENTRAGLIKFFRDNEGTQANTREYASRLIAAVMDPESLKVGGKGAVVGAVTGAVRVPVASTVGRSGGGRLAQEVAVNSAEISAGVSAAAAIEGEMPKAGDFAAAAALVMGFQAGGVAVRKTDSSVKAAQKRLQDHYVRTGERPEQALERGRRDPVFQQRIVSGDGEPSAVDVKIRDGEERLVIKEDNTPPQGVEAARQTDTPHSAIVAAAQPSTVLTGRNRPLAESASPADRAVANARTAIRSRIRPLDREGWTVKKVVDDLRYRFVNRLQFMVSATETSYKDATGKRLSIDDNPGELARLAYGAHAKADMAIKQGIFDADGKKKMSGFEEILQPLEKDIEAFVEYAVARRVVEKSQQGLETGFDVVQADLLVRTGSKEFQKAFGQLQEWMNTQLDDMVSAGVLGEEQRAKIIEQNENYVPFARLLDDVAKAPPGTTARGLPVRKVVKQFKGSEKEILDPLEVIVKNRYAVQQIIENNRARKRLVEFNDKLPEDFQFISKAKKKMSVTKIAEGDTQLKKFLEENGLDIQDATGIHLYRAMSKNLSDGDFIVLENGKPVVYTAKDPDLVRSLSSLDRSSMGLVVKILGAPSALLRTGVTINPEFVIKSTVREQIGGVLQNDFLVVPVVDAARGLAGLTKKDKDFNRWVNAGGANASMLSLDKQLFNVMTGKNTIGQHRDLTEQAWNVVSAPGRLATNVSLLAENSMRLGQFKRSIRAGKTDEVAALRARDVALDFSRRGAEGALEAYNAVTAWQGAAINGIDRFHTAWTRNPAGTAMKTAALVTLPSLVLWAMNREEEWYKNLEDWERAMFWHFPTGQNDATGEPIIARVPMPHQFGPLFGFLPIKMMEDFGKEDKEALDGVVETVRQTYSVPLIPVVATPLLELGANHSFFTGDPVVGQSQQRVLPEYRYTPYTTALTKELSKTLSLMPGAPDKFISPVALEHMVRGYSGSIGTNMLHLADFAGRKIGALPDIDKPDPQLADNPVYGAFFIRNASGGKDLSDFYDNAERLEQLKNSIRQEALRGGNVDEVERILDKRGIPALNPSKAKQAIGKLRQVAYSVHFHPDMPGDEKRQLLNELNKQQLMIAQAFNQQYDAFRKVEKESMK